MIKSLMYFCKNRSFHRATIILYTPRIVDKIFISYSIHATSYLKFYFFINMYLKMEHGKTPKSLNVMDNKVLASKWLYCTRNALISFIQFSKPSDFTCPPPQKKVHVYLGVKAHSMSTRESCVLILICWCYVPIRFPITMLIL